MLPTTFSDWRSAWRRQFCVAIRQRHGCTKRYECHKRRGQLQAEAGLDQPVARWRGARARRKGAEEP
jgi:hypothetical protein